MEDISGKFFAVLKMWYSVIDCDSMRLIGYMLMNRLKYSLCKRNYISLTHRVNYFPTQAEITFLIRRYIPEVIWMEFYMSADSTDHIFIKRDLRIRVTWSDLTFGRLYKSDVCLFSCKFVSFCTLSIDRQSKNRKDNKRVIIWSH